jgi:UDP-N-acetylmuramyl pentapeptide phosphotransferase/UDP-N-acetylglucosamine-1-phosphate transferase
MTSYLAQFSAAMAPFSVAAICTVLIMPLVIFAGDAGRNRTCVGPQNIHTGSTSRLGGAVVFLGYLAALTLAIKLEPMALPLPLLVSALPLLVVGLCEDVIGRISPKQRLIAAVASAALASAIAQGVITRLDLAFVDPWLAYLPLAVPLTWFMVAGACNAMNLIDGSHGLAGGTAILLFSGMALVAGRAGDDLVLLHALAMLGALTGFMLWNYPHGRVFLGDAGAYFVGFIYAQLSIQLIARNAEVSAWFVIALAAYPIVETLYSMYRRKILGHIASMQPDAQHLHSLLYRHFACSALRLPHGDRRTCNVQHFVGMERRVPMRKANARVAPRLWLHSSLCLVAALIFYDNTPALIGFTVVYAMYYLFCYRRAVRLSVKPSSQSAGSGPPGPPARGLV